MMSQNAVFDRRAVLKKTTTTTTTTTTAAMQVTFVTTNEIYGMSCIKLQKKRALYNYGMVP